MTVHLAALDSFEHESGPFSPQANSAREEIEGRVGTLEQAMRGETRNTAICIASDHGFASIDHHLNIAVPFVKAGLITPAKDWTATPWGTGGLAFVVLKTRTTPRYAARWRRCSTRLPPIRRTASTRFSTAPGSLPWGRRERRVCG
jgi:hypothetical protein